MINMVTTFRGNCVSTFIIVAYVFIAFVFFGLILMVGSMLNTVLRTLLKRRAKDK